MYKYCIPGYYLFHSRLKRKTEIISLVYVYPLFLFLLIYFWGDFDLAKFGLVFIVYFLTWLSFYEIGYLENDVFTIKKEKQPTLRISENAISTVEENYKKILSIRILIGLCSASILFLFNYLDWFSLNILGLFFSILITRLSFWLHNKLRSRWNIITYFFLSCGKYLSIPILFYYHLPNFTFLIAIILLLFPIPRTLEHAAKIKYDLVKFGKLIGNLDKFRIIYYLLIVIISLFLFVVLNFEKKYLIFLLSALWFFIFRFGLFFVIRLGGYKRTNFSSHKWD